MTSKKYGIIKNVFSDTQLKEWKKMYQRSKITKTLDGDSCWGIDKKNILHKWFINTVMPVIGSPFEKDIKLIFSSFIDLTIPLKTHTDIKALPEGENGKHYVSILIPYAVNQQREYIDKASTVFYTDDNVQIDKINWEENALIWWHSEMLHNSGDFKESGIKSKQYFITHTYV